MGCRESKEQCGPNLTERRKSNVCQDPNSVESAIPQVDPRLPLNARDIFKLKQSWKGIKRNMETTGVEMFIRLFQTEEEIGYLFSDFKNVHSDALRQNEVLEAHALLVMATLDKAITSLDDYEAVRESLLRTGAKHYRLKNYKPQYFRLMEEPFLSAIKITLGDRYSESMEIIYKKTIDFIITNLQTGILDAIAEGERTDNAENSQPAPIENTNHVTSTPTVQPLPVVS
ncbi:neuroglobin-like [Octopus vulgaris]|uniref:Neuroglobin-like n=2 Tax=Octopus TaxID=6643 RepID=A0AA36AMI7_OCTVU|nr:neuroglobin [Octopus sinensis]CAI9718945.1 neuroglobin-like [Octopus vulgaris]